MIPNTYAGICIRCGVRVNAEQGTHRFSTGAEHLFWPQIGFKNIGIVQHLECAEKHEGTQLHYKFNPAKGEQP